MDTLFNKNDLDELIIGLKTGFSRYALYAIQKFDEILNKYTTQNEEENGFHYLSVNKYLKSSYIERLKYILTDIDPVLNKLKTECLSINNSQDPKCAACDYAHEVKSGNEEYVCELENDPCVILRKSRIYDDLDLIGTLMKTNTYIQELTEILTENESELSEQPNQ